MQMDLWYELAIRESADVEDLATERRHDVEELDAASAEPADEEDD